ncbi:MAG: phosphodiester glycosidase family protein [Eubacteriales bacterium]|nr:phosphodiester glycosidase family protein [Eubacteriales bacterium]
MIRRRILYGALAAMLLLGAAGAALAQEPTIACDEVNGSWLYESDSLRVEITRRVFDDPLVWYEVDLRTSDASMLRGVLSADKKPQTHLKKPETLAREQQLVYAQTDDFYANRLKSKKLKTGVIIRNGSILYDSVYVGNGNPFPPLDAMALFGDGTMKVFAAREHTADEYLQMGAVDVFSFGPILIRDGQMDARVERRYANREPRSAIGIIEPHHFFSIIVEGRHDGSVGCGLKRIAERMLEVGVTDALNMDGGQTAALVFLGQQINQIGAYKGRARVRSVGGMIGVSDSAWNGEAP